MGRAAKTARPFFMRIWFAAALLVPVLVGPSQAQPARPNILLITLDTTRADRMGFLGSKRGLTPALDSFARSAIVFSRAYAQAPVTTVSHATLLTGSYPAGHHVDDFGALLPAAVPYLPQLLRDAGYRTAAFVGSTHVTEPERAALAQLRGIGLIDVLPRPLKGPNPFTYWDYRAGMFHQDMGMRIDLVYATATLAGAVTDAYLDREARKGKGPSDHAPIIVDC